VAKSIPWRRLIPAGAVVLLAFGGSVATSQTAYLVTDLAPGETGFASLTPGTFFSLGNRTLLTAGVGTSSNPAASSQLWVTDATAAGTQRLPDLCDSCEFQPEFLTQVGAVAFLAETTGLDQFGPAQLWRSDGTRAGTFQLPLGGAAVTLFVEYTVLDGKLYFVASVPLPGSPPDLQHSDQLWRSDGTLSGTFMVADFGSGGIHGFATAGGKLFILAPTAASGSSSTLWTSDGTRAGTAPVPGFQATNAKRLLGVGNRLLITAEDAAGSFQLWASDGSAAGTRQLTHLVTPRTYDPYAMPLALKTIGNGVCFVVTDVALGTQIWVTDLTPAGTLPATAFPASQPLFSPPASSQLEEVSSRLVFLAGAGGELGLWAVSPGNPASLTSLCSNRCPKTEALVKVGDRVAFVSGDANDNMDLWSSDGTQVGTRIIKPVLCGGICIPPKSLVALSGAAYFTFDVGTSLQSELWRTDGTPEGTVRVTTARVASLDPLPLGTVPGKLLFAGLDMGAKPNFPNFQEVEPELWVSDGTPAGTRQLTDQSEPNSFSPFGLVAAGEQVFFTSAFIDGGGACLAHGTASTASILPAPCSIFEPLIVLSGAAFFVPYASSQLWRSDGTAAGTQALTSFAAPQAVPSRVPLATAGNQVFFLVEGAGRAIWRTDATPAGTNKLFDLPEALSGIMRDLELLDGNFYLVADNDQGAEDVWRSDGTTTGTILLTNIVCCAPPLAVHFRFVELAGQVYWTDGASLWRTDGTMAGTHQVTHSGTALANPSDLVAAGGALYFFADQPSVPGRALWRSDGSDSGTVALHVFLHAVPGVRGTADPVGLTPFAGGLVFSGNDDTAGSELWFTDGTPAGTRLVKDIQPGAGSSNPSSFVVAGGRVFFAADDGVHGNELWESDGTAAGTRMVQDINPGPASSNPSGMTAAGSLLYFSADDGLTGQELWALPLGGSGACSPGATALCLAGGRFKVEAFWRDFQGNSGAGNAQPLTGDTGTFWFFSPDNVEVTVKVLDGRALDGHFWVFYGALSNVEYSLTVTDAATGLTRRYLNPLGQLASVGDTSAFGPAGASGGAPGNITAASRTAVAAPARELDARTAAAAAPMATLAAGAKTSPARSRAGAADTTAPRDAPGACQPTAQRLCLNGGRFAVEATWEDFSGHSGPGMAVGLTGETGYFWFFAAGNVETVLKVIDGRALNGHFWVFYGALSDVRYTLTVTDTATGAARIYDNPAGQFASVADTAAF
jgi:ELWxxDGT repeat protein